MTINDITTKLTRLQDEINMLAAQLPTNTEVSFGTLYYTQPTDEIPRKRLVIHVRETESQS